MPSGVVPLDRRWALLVVLLLVTAAAWPAHSQAEPPPAGQEIKSVSCASTAMCVAVGKTGGQDSVVQRWDGTGWSLVDDADGEIRKISCPSTTACVAVGVSAGAAQSWMVVELSGSWVVLEVAPSLPLAIDESALNDVKCTGSNCIAVGYYESATFHVPLIERWNGSFWSHQSGSFPLQGGGPNLMRGAACPSESFCISVGEAGGKPYSQTWSGVIWLSTSVPMPGGAASGKLTSISCSSPSFCMGVGNYVDSSGSERTLIERWNGSSWSIVSSPNPSDAKGHVNLADVSCLSPTSCFAVGYYASNLLSGAPLDLKTLILHWNGSAWTIQPSPQAPQMSYNALQGVSCVSVNACTAVGGFTNTLLGSPSPLVERWNGTEWSLKTVVPPVAFDDSAAVAEDVSATAVDVLANDSEVLVGSKEIVAKTNGSHGTVSITGGGSGLTYQPAANYCGPDSFTYTLNGGSTATVSVTVTCVDDAPVAVGDSKTLDEDSAATAIDALTNDTDVDGGPMTIASKTDGSHGTVSVLGGGIGLTYQPDPDYCGPDSFTYTLNGGSSATVSVTVTCVDDSPVAVSDSASVTEDATPTSIDVLANDADIDGGPKAISSASDPSHGTVALTGGSLGAHTGLTYAPDPNYCGPDSFTYTLNGGSSATVSINVTCVDDAPLAVNDSETVLEDSPPAVIDVLINDTDIDQGPKQIVARSNGSHGTVAIIGAGSGLTYQPAPNYCGPDSFTYTLNGGSTATVSITVACVEDPPPPVENPGGGSGGQGGGSSQTIVQNPPSSGPVVNVTPGVGVVSGRRRPRIAIKGAYAFFTLTCKVKEGDCAGTVTITASVPSVTLGPTNEKLTLVRGKFRIGAGRSVLVRAKLTKRGRDALKTRPTLRGVAGHMAIVDTTNGEKGEIDVNLVRRPKASLLPSGEG